MDRKEKVYAYISSKEYIPLTFEELADVLCVPDSDKSILKKILDTLAAEGKIFLSKKKRYASCEKNMMYPCVLHCSARSHFGFAVAKNLEKDIYISPDNMADAIDSDHVLVRVTKRSKTRDEGVVESVLQRGNTTISGVMLNEFNVRPDNPRIYKNIKLTETHNANSGDRVLVKITNYSKSVNICGIVTSVLGSSRELKTLTEAIIIEHNIKQEFEEATINQARSLTTELSKKDFDGRCDFTKKTVFTIDGDDARDFDDGVSLEVLENDNYELGVHIADVTNYVMHASPLDSEAFERGTSVYLADRVIPMLPLELSNGICSLNPNVDRLTLSVIMEIDSVGNIINHRLVKSVINSCERMTYNNVAKILDGDVELCEKYAHIVPVLENMHKLASILNARREKRGSINFDFPESRIIAGEDGRPTKIVKVVRNDAHKLIEEFMLTANETIAEFAFWADIPFVYRVHEQPDSEKMTAFRKFISGFGLHLKGLEVHPKDLQRILEEIKGTENETLIASYMLRSLMKAEYRAECNGHFGLAAKYYCHFTSPIRRYPDLIIHRILKDFLDGKDLSHYNDYVIGAAAHSSEKERSAELCERDVEDLMKAAYIEDFVGAEFEGQISGITPFGMFVMLANTVEGLVRLETIDDDFYEYDEVLRRLVGKRKGKTYNIGDTVEIEVAKSDLQTRQIDFVLKGSHPHRTASNPPIRHNKKAKRKFIKSRSKRGRRNGKV
ncbi:MAG: ribonuclease R [Firmicutes bacterium]|nr:ribonuclease R [Bacillota bacterium]